MMRTLNLTSIPEEWKTKYPGDLRGKISSCQSEMLNTYLEMVAAFIGETCGPSKIKESLVRGLNTIAYAHISNDTDLIQHISTNYCLDYYMDYDLAELKCDWPVDLKTLESVLGSMYIHTGDVTYDITESMIVYCGNDVRTDLNTKLESSNDTPVNADEPLLQETAEGIDAEEVSDVMERLFKADSPSTDGSTCEHSESMRSMKNNTSNQLFAKGTVSDSLDCEDAIAVDSIPELSESARLKKQYTDIEKTYGRMSNPYAEFVEDWRNGYPSISLEHRKFPTSSDKIWHQGEADGYDFCIYVSTPIVPAMQNDITVTTDVSKCRPADLIHLFPVVRNYPRFEWMYKNIEGAYHHPILGSILPIDDYSEAELIDNIVKYPVLSGMYRRDENQRIPSWRWTEINGELVSTLKIWDTLPVASKLPHNKKIVAEYFYRKYLLDRDIKGVQYKHPIEGTMKPYIMLFTTKEEYESMGYKNAVDLGRQCVENRVSYIQTRNPIIRRIGMPCTNA